MKVLIAIGSSLVRERLKAMLSELTGVEVIYEALDGEEALDVIGKLHPDVVLLNFRMAKVNGMTVLQRVRKDRGLPAVIMLADYPYRQYREKCMAAGADFFFDKSTEFDKIPEALERLIHRFNI